MKNKNIPISNDLETNNNSLIPDFSNPQDVVKAFLAAEIFDIKY